MCVTPVYLTNYMFLLHHHFRICGKSGAMLRIGAGEGLLVLIMCLYASTPS